MAGGQAIDLAVQGKQLGIAQVEAMHARKTGALIRASVLMAAACIPSLDARLFEALSGFATPIGLAFQIQDDLLDVIGDPATLGKATGADRARAGNTTPSRRYRDRSVAGAGALPARRGYGRPVAFWTSRAAPALAG